MSAIRKKKDGSPLVMKQIGYESMFLLPYSKAKSFAQLWGRIVRIKRGDGFDLVEFNTGRGIDRNYTRKVLCKTQDSRKQIATLTIGQYCICLCETPKYRRGVEMLCNALAFYPAYIPKKFDRLDLESEQEQQQDIEKLNETEEKQLDFDFLAQFEKKG